MFRSQSTFSYFVFPIGRRHQPITHIKFSPIRRQILINAARFWIDAYAIRCGLQLAVAECPLRVVAFVCHSGKVIHLSPNQFVMCGIDDLAI